MLDGDWQWLCSDCGKRAQMSPADSTSVGPGDHVKSPPALREPMRWAALASYATISRPADIALRSFSYLGHDEVDRTYDLLIAKAVVGLAAWTISLLVAALSVLVFWSGSPKE